MDETREILGTLKSRLVLAAYQEPATPSQVARALRLPANTVHYWTRKLADGGLLEEAGQDGRSRRYRSTAAAASAGSGSGVAFVGKTMDALGKLVVEATEARELRGEDDAQLPQLEVLEVNDLASEAVGDLLDRWQGKLATAAEGEDGGEDQTYTVAVLVAPGRLSERF